MRAAETCAETSAESRRHTPSLSDGRCGEMISPPLGGDLSALRQSRNDSPPNISPPSNSNEEEA